MTFGTPTPGFPDIIVHVTDANVARDIALRPRICAGEAYMDGCLTVEGDNILGLITLLRMNRRWKRGPSSVMQARSVI